MVIRQKFETLGYFGEPNVAFISNNKKSTFYISQEQTVMFNQFLIDNKYNVIWENSHFLLYAPPIKK